jgi:hypothetical protein
MTELDKEIQARVDIAMATNRVAREVKLKEDDDWN